MTDLLTYKNKYGEGFLHVAMKIIDKNTFTIVKFLLESGLDPNDKATLNQYTPLHYLIVYSRVCRCVNRSCDLTIYINIIKKIIDLLLQYGADINAYSVNKDLKISRCEEDVSYGMNAYMCGIMMNKDKRILDYLKEKGANFNHVKKLYLYHHMNFSKSGSMI